MADRNGTIWTLQTGGYKRFVTYISNSTRVTTDWLRCIVVFVSEDTNRENEKLLNSMISVELQLC